MAMVVKSEMGLLLLGTLFLTMGILYVIASRNPQRNLLTKVIYWLWTLPPFGGWQKTLVFINGIGFLIVGLALCCIWCFH
jgi:hypothetical protein